MEKTQSELLLAGLPVIIDRKRQTRCLAARETAGRQRDEQINRKAGEERHLRVIFPGLRNIMFGGLVLSVSVRGSGVLRSFPSTLRR